MAGFVACEMDDEIRGRPDFAGNSKDVVLFETSGFVPGWEVVSVADLPTGFYLSDEFDLTAGQHDVIGTVSVYNTDEYLWVEYKVTVDGLSLQEVHLYISDEPFDRRLAPGLAPIKADLDGVESYVVKIGLESLKLDVCDGGVVHLQAHAAMSDGETAYGGEITTSGRGRGAWFGNIEYFIPENVAPWTLEEDGELDREINCEYGEEALGIALEEALNLEPAFTHTYGVPTVTMTSDTEENELYEVITRTFTAVDPVCGFESIFVQTITVEFCEEDEDPIGGCQVEEAWGGHHKGGGDAWWFYYDRNSTMWQTIWAGQYHDAGRVKVELEELDFGFGGTIRGYHVTIVLMDGWELQDVEEAVKVEGFSSLPPSRPSPDQINHYKGNELSFTITRTTLQPVLHYFAIHLNVQLCE